MAEDEAAEFSGAHKSPLPLAVTLTEARGEGEKAKAKAKGWKRSAAVFGMAGVSNMAASFVTNPVNVVKVRMQLDGALSSNHERKYRGLVSGMFYIGRQEGLKGLFRGTGAALMREASYSSIRMGAYEPFKRALGGHDPAHTPLWIKVGAGSAAGIVGSAVANPTDVVIVRMQSSSLEKSVMGGGRTKSNYQGYVPLTLTKFAP